MNYKKGHIVRCREDLAQRYENLQQALSGPEGNKPNLIHINAYDTRLAVADFKAILDEVRRLK
jgi:hypothetical protein